MDYETRFETYPLKVRQYSSISFNDGEDPNTDKKDQEKPRSFKISEMTTSFKKKRGYESVENKSGLPRLRDDDSSV